MRTLTGICENWEERFVFSILCASVLESHEWRSLDCTYYPRHHTYRSMDSMEPSHMCQPNEPMSIFLGPTLFHLNLYSIFFSCSRSSKVHFKQYNPGYRMKFISSCIYEILWLHFLEVFIPLSLDGPLNSSANDVSNSPRPPQFNQAIIGGRRSSTIKVAQTQRRTFSAPSSPRKSFWLVNVSLCRLIEQLRCGINRW